MNAIRIILFLLFFATAAGAETLTIGPWFNEAPNEGRAAGATTIDLGAPAARGGVIDSVSFVPVQLDCRVRIRFFRRSGDTFTPFAERGQFAPAPLNHPANPRWRRVQLNPPVRVEAGDLIAISPVGNCQPVSNYCAGAVGRLLLVNNYTGGPVQRSAGEEVMGCRVALHGTGTADPAPAELLKGVLPVIGSAAGNHGSFFRTSLQLAHPAPTGSAPLSGRLVFRRAGQEGSDSDPSLPFLLMPNEVRTFTDFLPAIGLSGVGSLDVIGFEGEAMPLITARVYNDAGANGTSGFIEKVVSDVADVVDFERPGYLVTPVDTARTRFNIGVRTLEAAAVTFVLYGGGGEAVASVTRDYPANFFEQFGADAVLGPFESSQLIEVRSTGQVIVYGSTTDNRTNDPALALATAPVRR